MAKITDNNGFNPCPAGKLLEVEFEAAFKSLDVATTRLDVSCEKLGKQLEVLTRNSIQQQGRMESVLRSIEKLEKACGLSQELEVGFERHLATHEETKRLEADTGRRWGIVSGVGGLSLIELVRFLFSNR